MWLMCGLIWMITSAKEINKVAREDTPNMVNENIHFLIPFAKGFAIALGMIISPFYYTHRIIKRIMKFFY